MTDRFADADAILDGRLVADGHGPAERPLGQQAQDSARVLHAADDEGRNAFLSTMKHGDAVEGGTVFDPAALFQQGVIVGIAAVQIAGVAWAEWLLQAKELPAINLGIARAAAARIIAGGHE